VILDFFFDREPYSEYAAQVLNLCEEQKIKGFVTPVAISNVYHLLRKIGKHELIIEKLKQLLTIIDIAEMDKTIVLNALNSQFKDFEDALQNFSALGKENINVILTRNLKDFKKSTLAIMTPESYLKGKPNS
jgi:predicted nucleic acid-binding protein